MGTGTQGIGAGHKGGQTEMTTNAPMQAFGKTAETCSQPQDEDSL